MVCQMNIASIYKIVDLKHWARGMLKPPSTPLGTLLDFMVTLS